MLCRPLDLACSCPPRNLKLAFRWITITTLMTIALPFYGSAFDTKPFRLGRDCQTPVVEVYVAQLPLPGPPLFTSILRSRSSTAFESVIP